ncbi:MAG: TrmB family transcriptional regulator [Candidatus Bathyarchaeia archaeon]
MTINEENLSVFTELGMTIQQAKVYVTLSKLEQATVKTIAITAQMNRAEVYRVIPELQRRGLVKKIISAPIAFQAAPLSEGFAILLEYNAEKHRKIQRQTQQFLREFDSHNENTSQENSEYYLATGLRAVKRNYRSDLHGTQTSKDCILDWKTMSDAVNRDFEYIEEAIERGAKIRYITCAPKDAKMPQFIKALAKTNSFELKTVSEVPKAGVDIYDKKIIHFIVSNTNEEEIEVLRTTSSALVELAQDYFELKWQSAKKPRWYKKKRQQKTSMREMVCWGSGTES